MSTATGVAKIGDYATPGTDPLKVAALLALIPNPDGPVGSNGAVVGVNGSTNSYLDEMSPAAAVQLRVELNALMAAVT